MPFFSHGSHNGQAPIKLYFISDILIIYFGPYFNFQANHVKQTMIANTCLC